MLQKSGVILLTAVLLFNFSGINFAQEAKLVAAAKAAAKKKKEFPDFKEIVTDKYKKIEGFYTLYRHQEKERGYLEIPAGTMGQDFLLATTITEGSIYAGFQWSDALLYWKRYDKKLALMQKQLRYRTGDASSPLGTSVARTYKDTLVATYNIVTLNGGNPVLDLGGFTYGSIGTFFGYWFQPGNQALGKYTQLKGFPQNVEMSIEFPDRYGEFITLHYSLRNLPASDYKPREADDRVGYFLNAHKDMTGGNREENNFVRQINRWNLKKQDPKLAKSPVVEPIIFYIEKTVPIKYRQAVREGIEEWNRAFEKVGYLNAIEVRQQTSTNEFKDLDPADSRYNFFRWITSGMSFAMGPSRVDPRTGEILDADIIFDDGMLKWSLFEYDRWIREESAKVNNPRFQRYLKRYPENHPRRLRFEKVAKEFKEETHSHAHANPKALGKRDRMIRQAMEKGELKKFQRPTCMLGTGRTHQLKFAGAYFATMNFAKDAPKTPEAPKEKTWPDEFIYQVIKETVMHELGHTLGLRHNFKASAWKSLADINSKAKPATISGSVMDYNPINIKAPTKDAIQGNWQNTTLGPYDYWAIEYGYSSSEKAEDLKKIAAQGAKDGYDFATDEDSYGPDPYIGVWELGNDSVAYAKHRIQLADALLGNLVKRTLKKGDPYRDLTNAFSMALWEYAVNGSLVVRNLGGVSVNRDHFGDPDGRDPAVLISGKKQREALNFVCEKIFAKDAFKLAPEILTKLAPNNYTHWGTGWWKTHSFNVYDEISYIQWWVFYDIFYLNDVLHRVYNNELKSTEEDALTLPEIFTSVRSAIWSELKESNVKATNQAPFINGYRRNLQREHLQTIIDIAMEDKYGSSPVAARTLAWYDLKTLKKDIDSALKNADLSKDAYSLSHLEEASKRIQKALDAAYSLD